MICCSFYDVHRLPLSNPNGGEYVFWEIEWGSFWRQLDWFRCNVCQFPAPRVSDTGLLTRVLNCPSAR